MKHRGIALILLVLPAMIAGAQPSEESDFLLDFEKAHAFRDGDMRQLAYFEECAETEFECGMIAGTVLRERKRIAEAEDFYRKALATGFKPAATAIANMHTQVEAHVEGFAWSQLAYVLDDPRQELDKEEIRGLISFRLLATNYQLMDKQQRLEAEQRAHEVVNEWTPKIHDKIPNTEYYREDAPLKILERVNPKYPRDMAIKRINGFVLLYGQVDIEGKLVDTIAMDFSHRRFEKESIKAFSKWRFKVTDPARENPVSVIQRIDFFLEEHASR